MAKLKDDTKKEILEEMDDFYDKVKKEREPYERTWYFNIAFHLGHQWIAWNEYTRRIEEPKAPSWRVRITANHVAPIDNQIIAKLTKNRPIHQVIPATSEDADVNTARMGEKVLQYLARILKGQTKNQEMWLWGVITGTAFKVPYWDANAREVIDEENQTHLGEAALDILSCFEVYPDIGATSEDMDKILIARTRSLDYIREKYPDTGEEVHDEGISGKTPVEERLFDMMNKSAPDYQPPANKNVTNKDKDKRGNAIVKEYRQKPCSKYPKGRYIVFANNVLLNPENMDLPYKHLIKERKLGIIKYDYEKVPGRFWGKGRPEDLIPLQKEYNKCRSQIIEIKNLMAKPKWAVPIGSGIKKTHLTSEPGEVVYYNPGVSAPSQMQVASLPSYVLREPENTKGDMQDISGLHEVCVDDKTECLTKNGFKKYNEVKIGDEILTFNMKLQKAEWKKIDKVHTFNHNGLLHRLENGNISSLCTPNHKWLVKRDSGRYGLVETSKLNTDCSILLRSEVLLTTIRKYSDEYVKLIGWVVTEGTYSLSKASIKRGRQTIRISQSMKANPENCKEIEDIIIKLYGKCGKGKQKDGCIQYYFAKDLARKIRKDFPDKVLTYDFINSLTKNQLKLLLTTMIKADGHDPKKGNGSGKRFYSSDIKLAKQFQYICVLSGYASNLNVFRKAEGIHKTIYFVSVKLSKLASYRFMKNSQVEYRGITWCPETVNETFLARRNGLVYFTGNSRAQVPGGVRSGLAIQYLQEQDDTRLGPVIARYEEAEAECGHQFLCLVKECYQEQRLIRLIGKNSRVEAFDFKGSQLGDNLDVVVQAGSAFPLNKVAKQQFVLGLWKEKLIPDPRQILKMLEFGTFEEIYEDFALDEKNAQEENKLTTDGQPVQAQQFDNDDIHIYEHMRDVKANKYPPMILEFKMRHIDEHSQRKAQMLQAMPSPEQMSGKGLSPKQQTQLTPKKDAGLIGAGG